VLAWLELNYNKLPVKGQRLILLVLIVFLLPNKLIEKAENFVDGRVWAIIRPLKEKRELELFQFRQQLDRVEASTKRTENFILYGKKPTE
jgi:hypothetical protein